MNANILFWLFLQEEPSAALGIGMFIGILLVYAFCAYCLQVIAQKTNTDPGWWAWVPILNVLLMLKIAGRPTWWIILFFVPLVSIVIGILVFVDICKKRGKSGALAIGMLIPVVNFGVLGYLAFSD